MKLKTKVICGYYKQIINMDQNELDLFGKQANKFYNKNYHIN